MNFKKSDWELSVWSLDILGGIEINTGLIFNYGWLLESFPLHGDPTQQPLPWDWARCRLGLIEFTSLIRRLKLNLWDKLKHRLWPCFLVLLTSESETNFVVLPSLMNLWKRSVLKMTKQPCHLQECPSTEGSGVTQQFYTSLFKPKVSSQE